MQHYHDIFSNQKINNICRELVILNSCSMLEFFRKQEYIAKLVESLSINELHELGENNQTILHVISSLPGLATLQFLKVLLTNPSINLNLQDSDGNTPVHIIARKSWGRNMEDTFRPFDMSDPMLDLILNAKNLQHKINPNIQNNQGNTILHEVFFTVQGIIVRIDQAIKFLSPVYFKNFSELPDLTIKNHSGHMTEDFFKSYVEDTDHPELFIHAVGRQTEFNNSEQTILNIIKNYPDELSISNFSKFLLKNFDKIEQNTIDSIISKEFLPFLRDYQSFANDEAKLDSLRFYILRDFSENSDIFILKKLDNYINDHFFYLTGICKVFSCQIEKSYSVETINLPTEIVSHISKYLSLKDIKEDFLDHSLMLQGAESLIDLENH